MKNILRILYIATALLASAHCRYRKLPQKWDLVEITLISVEIRVPQTFFFKQIFKRNLFFFILLLLKYIILQKDGGNCSYKCPYKLPIGVHTYIYICMIARKSHASISREFLCIVHPPLPIFLSFFCPLSIFFCSQKRVISCRVTSELSRSFKDFLENVTF